MGKAWLAVAATLISAPAAQAGVHPAEVEARLAFLVHDWTIEGMEGAYRETCEWYHERSFVVCNTTETEDGKVLRSVSILGWSAQSRAYTYHHYSSTGRSRSEVGYPTPEGGMVFLGERQSAAGATQYRSVLRPRSPGPGFHFAQTRSVNGGPWEPSADFQYVPYGTRPTRR
jgi:hypothetical protein